MSKDTFWTVWLGALATFMGAWTGYCFRGSDWKRRATLPAEASDKRFCRDCRWLTAEPTGLFGRPDYTFARCMHPTSIRNEGEVLVSGQYTPDNQHYCATVRKSTYGTECCGPDGTHWEPQQ